MILHDLVGSESNPIYQKLEIENGARQYDFLRSIVEVSIQAGRPFLSQAIIRSLNFHAITCLHVNAGAYRPCEVTVGSYSPPAQFQVAGLMDDFVSQVNRHWTELDPVALAAFVLWKLNNIHPFINGNGRTARASCLYVLCVTTGGWLPGEPILPELIKRDRDDYIRVLREVDLSAISGRVNLPAISGRVNLRPLHEFLQVLLDEQMKSAGK